jgi:exopolyphosphatase / guanosine-5'-triphosphate,3'-diphosphate pyrophosphatase
VRVAALDQGTNTTRLLVADVVDGRLEEVVRRTAITRLGEGVDRRKRLLPLPIARVRNVLTDYRRELEALGSERTLLIATSAVRDAENGEAFLGEIEWSYGFATQLLSGDEEAELVLRGVGDVDDETVVLDVGGGSTELVRRGYRASVDIGSVRLTERFVHSDPPTADEIGACRAFARDVLPNDVRAARVVGVAGTVSSLAALDLGLEEYDRDRVHGHVLTKKAVKKQLERLASMTEAQRREVLLEPGRAPVIVAGAVIVREALRALDVSELRVSEHDILDGAALAAAELPEPEEGAAPPGAYTCC